MKNLHLKALASSFNDKDYTLECVMTAEVVDRHGEIVDIDTMQTESFLLNPVVVQSHDYDELSVGKVLSITKTVNDTGIKIMTCVIKFAVEEYDMAKTHWNLYRGGFMNAFSIGFRVGAVQTEADSGVVRLMNCELLEISCVTIPANQLALAKSKGVEIAPVISSLQNKEKALKALLIDVKTALDVGTTVDKQETPVILNKEVESKKRIGLLLSKAIRLL